MKNTALRGLAAAGAAILLAGPALSADAARGRELAGACRVCHGLDGVGTNPMVPNIGGQSAQYLTKALQDFRDGRREDPQMSIMSQNLSDADIADLAAWYASIRASYEMPDG
jgi:cytochrome c553